MCVCIPILPRGLPWDMKMSDTGPGLGCSHCRTWPNVQPANFDPLFPADTVNKQHFSV